MMLVRSGKNTLIFIQLNYCLTIYSSYSTPYRIETKSHIDLLPRNDLNFNYKPTYRLMLLDFYFWIHVFVSTYNFSCQ